MPYRPENRGFTRPFLEAECPGCGHTRGNHRNRSSACLDPGCGCYKFGDGHLLPGSQQAVAARREVAASPRVTVRRPAVGITAREPEVLRCPFCHDSDFETEAAVRCKACKAWQHADCVDESVDGCCGACKAEFP